MQPFQTFDCDQQLMEIIAARNAMIDAASPGRRRSRHKKLVQWIRMQRDAGAQITIGEEQFQRALPTDMAGAFLAGRLGFWQRGSPSGCWTGVVSSRLGRRLDRQSDWFHALRAACVHIQRNHQVLLTSAGSATERFAIRAAELFGLRTLRTHQPLKNHSFRRWLERLVRIAADNNSELHEVWFSPPAHEQNTDVRQPMSLGPERDLVVSALADRLFVLHVRRGGNIDRLVRARLASATTIPHQVFIATTPALVDSELVAGLVDLGATAWQVPDDRQGTLEALLHHPALECSTSPIRRTQKADILAYHVDAEWPFLTHCTRAASGPWPDESEADYLAELLTKFTLSPRTPFDALLRIVRQRRLLASGQGIRRKLPVVCWSELQLDELLRRRVFRPHRVRWDYEPYGICVHRDWLYERGARPVIYGDEHDWKTLGELERPFFQPRTTRGRTSSRAHDWTVEREWRLIGDLPLDQVPKEAARLFVPTMQEAEHLAEISPWPIVVVSQNSNHRWTAATAP